MIKSDYKYLGDHQDDVITTTMFPLPGERERESIYYLHIFPKSIVLKSGTVITSKTR